MVRRTEPQGQGQSQEQGQEQEQEQGREAADQDERIGEAIEAYLALAEAGPPPDPEEFAGRYPGLEADLAAALEGLALVRGLVGDSGGQGHGPGSRLETGRRIAGYRIVRELGRGGMGVVYEAVHVGLDRPVALKVLGSHAAPDSSGRRRFLNEARTAAGLHHTHIVPVFDVGQVGGLCYYAMQRIEGSGLDRVVRHLRRDRLTAAGTASGVNTPLLSRLSLRASPGPKGAAAAAGAPPRGSESDTGAWPDLGLASGAGAGAGAGGGLGLARPERDDDGPPPFEPPRGSAYYRWVAGVGRAAAEALGHAHGRGVIHRDVKPSNLLVDGRGLVWVADFGLARRLADPSQTQHDSLLGTPRYMSPEQARVGAIDGRSDLYSLGATLYELLTLRPPFDGRSAAELVDQIAGRDPAPPRQADPRVPRDLETIVLKLLGKRAADRYATADALSEDLTRFLNYEPVHARRISAAGRLWRFAQRHPSLTGVSAAAAATVLAVSTVAYVKVRNERDAAVHARSETQEALRRQLNERNAAVLARSEAQAALRRQLWREASLVRGSNVPDRRATGLNLIRDASALKPEPWLRTELRNEAVELLILRDVEPRRTLATGRARGLAFGPDGSRLAALTSGDDGESVGVWDVARREKLSEGRLRPDFNGIGPGRGGGGGGGGGGGRRGGGGPGLAVAGRCVAAVAPGGQGVRLYDLVTGAWMPELKMPGRRVVGLLASPDGRRLVTVEADPGARDGPPAPAERFQVNLWDPDSPAAPLATLAQWSQDAAGPPPPPLVALSPDGSTVAAAQSQRTGVSLWSAETGLAAGQVETQTELTALALGPDKQLATAGSGEIRLWDVESHATMPSLTPNQSRVRLLRFSPRGSLLAVVGSLSRNVEIWDTASHSVVAVLPTADPISDVAFSPDGRTLAAAGLGDTTSVWALADPEVRVRLSGFDAVTRSMAFRADGLLAMGAYNGRIRFWDEGRCVQGRRPHEPVEAEPAKDPARDREEPVRSDRPASLAFDDQGRLITLEPDSMRVWDKPPLCDGGSKIALPGAPLRLPFPFPVLAASRDGRTAVVGRVAQAGEDRTAQLLLWRSDEPGRVRELTPPPNPDGAHRGRPRGRNGRFNPFPGWLALALAPAGDRLYLVDVGGRVHAWSLDGSAASPLGWSDPPADASSLALSADGRVLAVGARTAGVVTLVDTDSGAVRARLRPTPGGEADGQVWSLAFAPDGKALAVGSAQGPIHIWSLDDTSAPSLRLPGHRGFVAALAYDAQGRRLASAGSDKTVDVWDLDRIREDFVKLDLDW